MVLSTLLNLTQLELLVCTHNQNDSVYHRYHLVLIYL